MGFESREWSAGLLAEGLESSILRVVAVRADKLGPWARPHGHGRSRSSKTFGRLGLEGLTVGA